MPGDLALGATRACLRSLSVLSRHAAIRVAARLYTTPPRGKPMGAADRALFAEARTGTVSFRDAQLPYWEWGEPAAPRILLVHGWGVDPWLFSPLVRALRDAGFAVIAYASPGHEGRRRYRTTAMTWVHAFHAVAARLGPFHGLIGHSLGAATIVCAARHPLPAQRIVLFSTCSDLVENTDAFVERLGLDREAARSMRARIWADYRQDCESLATDWDGLYTATSGVPTLLVHDRDDPLLRPVHSTRIAERWENASMHMTEGLGHFAVARNPDIIRQSLAFLCPVPSP